MSLQMQSSFEDPIRDINRRAWDNLVRQKSRFTIPARNEDFEHPLKTIDACGWLGGNIRGLRVLCLAAGGGKHGPLYAAAGATVTVVDISEAMLALDRQVAAERRLSLRTIQASMEHMPMLQTGEFDLVVQPVSTCYVPDVRAVYREVARVTRPGGLYISQHKQPASLQAELRPMAAGYAVVEPYYRRGPLPPVRGSLLREDGTQEFLHRWEELLGQLCRSGFVIEDVMEPCHANPQAQPGSWGHRCCYLPPYIRIKARRVESRTALSL